MFRRNVSGQGIGFALVNASTGLPLTGATVTVSVVIDNAAQFTGAGAVSEKGNGQYWYALPIGETNGKEVSLLFSASGAVSVEKTFVTTAADPTDGVAFGLTDLPAIKAKTDLIVDLNVTQFAESYAAVGQSCTMPQLLYMLYQALTQVQISGLQIVGLKLDGSAGMSWNILVDGNNNPVGIKRVT